MMEDSISQEVLKTYHDRHVLDWGTQYHKLPYRKGELNLKREANIII